MSTNASDWTFIHSLEGMIKYIRLGYTITQIKNISLVSIPRHVIEDMYGMAQKEIYFQDNIKPSKIGKLIYD